MTAYKSERLTLKLLEREAITDEYVNWHNNKELLKFYSSSGKQFTKKVHYRGTGYLPE